MKNYLLTTPFARSLYENVAKNLPIIDYHNHLSMDELGDNRQYKDIYELWIKSDPYKHRLMRICGVAEDYITGDKSPYEKFCKWCEIFPLLVGTPCFDWTRLELKRIFNIDTIPGLDNAKELWNATNSMLAQPEFSVNSLLKQFHVEFLSPVISICDDISLFSHMDKMFPSLRGDDILCPTAELIDKLGLLTQTEIYDEESLKKALSIRISFLSKAGCRFADHALDHGFIYTAEKYQTDKLIEKIVKREQLSHSEKLSISSAIIRILAGLYAKYHITLLLHLGAQRYTSTRLREVAGPAGGYAAIGDNVNITSITSLLNDVEQRYELPKTVLFSLNPTDNAKLAVLCGSYSKDNVEALVSQGPAWWWNDHLHGIKDSLSDFSTYGVLSTFVGMTTDSRSILSLVRHEYFRRVLCMWIGEKVNQGEFDDSFELWKGVVEKICYYNAKKLIETE